LAQIHIGKGTSLVKVRADVRIVILDGLWLDELKRAGGKYGKG